MRWGGAPERGAAPPQLLPAGTQPAPPGGGGFRCVAQAVRRDRHPAMASQLCAPLATGYSVQNDWPSWPPRLQENLSGLRLRTWLPESGGDRGQLHARACGHAARGRRGGGQETAPGCSSPPRPPSGWRRESDARGTTAEAAAWTPAHAQPAHSQPQLHCAPHACRQFDATGLDFIFKSGPGPKATVGSKTRHRLIRSGNICRKDK